MPVTRETDVAAAAAEYPAPDIALITVGEADLPGVLRRCLHHGRTRAGMLQNELLPRDWAAADITDPTVAVVWFEKKPGQDVKVIIPTPIGGPYAATLVSSLATIGISANVATTSDELTAELVTKNLYILTANIGGLVTRGTVDHLWNENRDMAAEVASEVLDIQEWLVDAELDRPRHVAGMEAAINGDPGHGATGRSAPARLARAISHADQAGLAVPRLRTIAAES